MPTYPPNVTFTPRLAMPRPGLDDPADGPDAFNDLTDYLDPIATVYSQGTLAARPAAGVVGRLYWATDVRAFYYDDATAWRSVAGTAGVGAALPILDVGVQGQNRAGRQLTVADFTSLGLAQPIGLWNLSDLSNLGSDARALSNKGAVPFGVGINGVASSAAVFAGSASQALYIPDSGAADPLRIKTGSWGCWLRTAKRGIAQTFLSKWRGAGQASWIISVDTTNTASVSISRDGAEAIPVVSVSDVCDDRWHFIVLTFDGTALRLYVDAVSEGIAFATGTLAAVTAPLNIGGAAADASTATAAPHYGRVDETFISADVPSEDQIRGLYCASIPHGLGVVPGAVRLSVHRRRKGGPLTPADFTTTPLRLHNFTAGALTDQGSGNVALVNAGTAPIAVAGADGAPVGALSLGATATAHLMATDAGLPAALAARSYGCWLKTTGTATGTIIGWGTVSTGDARLIISANNLAAYSGSDLITGPYAADGQWHLTVVCEDNAAGDGLRRRLYLDGRLVGASTVLNSITLAGANRYRVGAGPDGAFPLPGQFDGAFVTGYAMAQDEVLRLYAKGSQDLGASPKEPGSHVERLDASGLLWVADTLDSQYTCDIGVVT